MTWEEAQKLIPEQFKDCKVIGCSENDKYLSFAVVPKNAKPVTYDGIHSSYEYCGNGWMINKKNERIIFIYRYSLFRRKY